MSCALIEGDSAALEAWGGSCPSRRLLSSNPGEVTEL